MAVQLSQYRELYFSEAREKLASIAAALRKLERAPGEQAAFEAAFRATHTLKGMSATMGYDELTVFAHAFEDLLESAREHSDGVSNADIYPLFHTLDHLNSVMSRLESGESPEADAFSADGTVTPTGIERPSGDASSLVRVNCDQLDEVMARTVELLASANRLAYAEVNAGEEGTEAQWRDHLSLLKRLQAAAWSLQMAPIGEVFDRFPRMIHDLAREQRKEIRVMIEGRETEVGRRALEEVAEPLVHLLRNAVTHGIEPLAERLSAGKDPRGLVFLRACQRGDSITIEVGDDGRGLDAQRILKAAHEQAFISDTQRRTLGEAEAYDLIMLSGFSLSPIVTKASGRGVGMDIVRNKILALQGTMHIRSQPGRGATFVLDLPRTLGAVQVELVRVSEQILAIPSAQIESRIPLAQRDLTDLRQGEIKVADRSLRLIDLNALLHLPSHPSSESSGLVVLNGRAGVALRVDEFLGKALWRKPEQDEAQTVPLLDIDQLSAS